jgi:hypothetical protein
MSHFMSDLLLTSLLAQVTINGPYANLGGVIEEDDAGEGDDDFRTLTEYNIVGCSDKAINQCFKGADGVWGRCDMCVCESFQDLKNSSGKSTDCVANEDLFNCYYRIDDSSVGALGGISCKSTMKTSWIIGFVFIGLFGCCLCVYCVFLGIMTTKSKGRADTEDSVAGERGTPVQYTLPHQQARPIKKSSRPSYGEIDMPTL